MLTLGPWFVVRFGEAVESLGGGSLRVPQWSCSISFCLLPPFLLAHSGSMESGDHCLHPLQPRVTRNPFLFSCPPWALSQQQNVSRMLGRKKNQDRSETQHYGPEVQGLPKRGTQGQALTIQSSIVPVTPDQLCTHDVKAHTRVWE